MESVLCIKHKCFAQTNHVSLHHQLTSFRSDTGLVTATHAQAEEGMQIFEKQKRTVPEPKIYHFHHPEDSLPMSPGSSGWNSGYCLWLILLPSSQEHLWYINPQKKSLNLVQHFHPATLPVFLEQNTFFFLHLASYSIELMEGFYKFIPSKKKLIKFLIIVKFVLIPN